MGFTTVFQHVFALVFQGVFTLIFQCVFTRVFDVCVLSLCFSVLPMCFTLVFYPCVSDGEISPLFHTQLSCSGSEHLFLSNV